MWIHRVGLPSLWKKSPVFHDVSARIFHTRTAEQPQKLQVKKMLPSKFSPIIEEITKMFHFACVGAAMGILNIGIIYTLTSILGIYYIYSAIFSYQVLLVLSFSSNDKLTFRSITNHNLEKKLHRFGSYYLVSLAGMIFYITIMFLLTEYLSIFYLISSIIATLLVFLWNYFVNKNVTWSEKK
jgi:putative flippase GtrA